MTVHLALRKHDTRWTARAICWWTGSIYSHCELVADGWCYSSSAMDGGVRAKQIDLDPVKWDLIELPWADARKVVAYFVKTDGDTYGWWSLLKSQLFNRNVAKPGQQFCSEWCANALGLPNAVIHSPGSLAAEIRSRESGFFTPGENHGTVRDTPLSD
jgi:hypothetical protein